MCDSSSSFAPPGWRVDEPVLAEQPLAASLVADERAGSA